jgi:hypothetical protein
MRHDFVYKNPPGKSSIVNLRDDVRVVARRGRKKRVTMMCPVVALTLIALVGTIVRVFYWKSSRRGALGLDARLEEFDCLPMQYKSVPTAFFASRLID